MELVYDTNYPSIDHLRVRAKARIPKFAFEYLDGGCNNEVNLDRNTREIRDIQLKPYYLKPYDGINLKTKLFGEEYSAPFGISPVGLQGLMWPGATEILAKAAYDHELPFILSTVATASIEEVAKITHGKAWFQLYHPAETDLRDKILQRCRDAEVPVLVILADVPTFAIRPKEIKNGLSIPPKITLENMVQIMLHPNWALNTLFKGQPEFKTVKPYIPKGLSLGHLGLFMNKTFSGRLNDDKIKAIRDQWKGKLVIKGLSTPEDVAHARTLGLDGVLVSNHGGRQLDSGESAIASLKNILDAKVAGDMTVMMDSGIRTGTDIANTMAIGADFAFLGRSPMYGVAALGKKGGNHTLSILKRELQQVLEQVCCATPQELKNHLVK